MPIYEFVCEPCNKVFEVLFRSSTEKQKVTCPTCGGVKIRKKLSTFGAKVCGDGGGPGTFKSSVGGGGSCGSCSSSSCSGCH